MSKKLQFCFLIAGIFATIVLLFKTSEALAIYTYSQGGTGTSTPSVGQLAWWSKTALRGVATTSASCAGSASCSSFTVIGTSPVTITGTLSWPFTTGLSNFGVPVQATTTPMWFQNGLMASTTSYFVNASTTQFTASDTAWFSNTITSGTATTTELCFANGLCMSSPAIQGSNVTMFHWNGASEIAGYEMFRTEPDPITAETTETCSADSDVAGGYCLIDPYVSTTSLSAVGPLVLTKIPAGTFTFQYYGASSRTSGITSLVATMYKRSAAGTETFIGQATSTDINNSTTALLDAFTLTLTSEVPFLTTDRLVVKVYGWTDNGTARDVSFSYGGTQKYSHVETPITIASEAVGFLPAVNTWTALNLFTAGIQASSTSQLIYASTTAISASDTVFGGKFVQTEAAATSTYAGHVEITGNLKVSGNFYAPVRIVSTGDVTVGGNLIVPNITSALPLADANGVMGEYAGATCTNQFVRSLSAAGAATCATVANTDLANSTISGVSLGSNLAALTNGSTLTGSSYNGSGAISDWDIDLTNGNVWTGLQVFSNAASTTIAKGLYADTIAARYFMATSTATSTFAGGLNLTSGCVAINGTCITGGGGSGTVTSIAFGDALNGGTITTSGDVNLKSYFATSTADSIGYLMYSGSTNGWPAKVAYVATGTISASLPLSVTAGRSAIGGAAAFSIADAVADGSTKGASTYTAADFDAASGVISLDRAITGAFTGAWAFNNAASTTVAKGLYANTMGAQYFISTSTTAWNSLPNILATNASTTNITVATKLDVGGVEVSPYSYASYNYATSTAWTATTTRFMEQAYTTTTYYGVKCKVKPTGATVDVQIGNGVSSTTMVVASSTNNTFTFSSPVSFTGNSSISIDYGTPASSPVEIVCTTKRAFKQ